MLASFSASALHAQVANLNGDHRVIPQSTEPGNLDADGDLGWGRTPGSPGAVAGKLRYFDSPSQLAFDATEADAIFTWNDDATDTLRDFKMKLDANNVLSLYKTDGSAASISLTPDTGAIKLSGTGAGLFNGSGGGVLQIDGSGRPYFATKPIFQDGVDFGSGGTLDDEKVGYLQGLLTGFGYDPNAGTYSDVTKIGPGSGLGVYELVAANGHIYFVAHISGQVKLGSTTYDSANGSFVIAKAAYDGTPSWVRQVKMNTSSSYFVPNSIAVNASGSVVVGGMFSGSFTNLGSQNLTASGDMDGFVLVLNSSGAPQWSKAISSSSSPREDVYGVAIDSSGNVAAVGQLDGTTPSIDLGNGTLTSAGGTDGYLVKYNSSGTASWSKLIGGTAFDSARGVAFTSGGGLVVGGWGGTTTNLGAYNFTSAGASDVWALGLNSSGTVQWSRPMGGSVSSTFENFDSLALDSSGNIYVLMGLYGTTSNLGSHNKTSAGSIDPMVVSLDSSGAVRWSRVMGSTENDSPAGISVDSADTVIIGASIRGSTTNMGSFNVTGLGENDGMIATMDSSGTLLSSRAIGGSGGDWLSGARPLGSLSTGMALYGSVNTIINLGDTRIPPGSYFVTIPGGAITTAPDATPAPLTWGGGYSAGSGSMAVGAQAYADGTQSVAFSRSAATGENAFAANSAQAKGLNTAAFGDRSYAYGDGAAAFGLQTSAYGKGTFAAGRYSGANGDYSMAFGDSSYAMGVGSLAGGWISNATGDYSIAIGEFTTAEGPGSVAFGAYTYATGMYSSVLGADNVASGDFSLAGGLSSKAESFVSTALGQGNIGGGHPANWVDTDPLFEIGNTNSTARSNAVTTLKNGQTTLTNRAWKAAVTAEPTEALDDPEDANDSGGKALVVEGHTDLQGRVTIRPQGDLSMDGFTNGAP